MVWEQIFSWPRQSDWVLVSKKSSIQPLLISPFHHIPFFYHASRGYHLIKLHTPKSWLCSKATVLEKQNLSTSPSCIFPSQAFISTAAIFISTWHPGPWSSHLNVNASDLLSKNTINCAWQFFVKLKRIGRRKERKDREREIYQNIFQESFHRIWRHFY